MLIKDFTEGQKAYVIDEHVGRNQEPEITEVTVTSIGRKYVYVNLRGEKRYAETYKDYLTEDSMYGTGTLLFKTMQDAEEYLEAQELRKWLSNINFREVNNYTLEQLRNVKEILG